MGLFLLLTLPLFFYSLGGYSLVDFDEAWYGEIARNILLTGQPFLLSFNDAFYLDHPPLGFILMAFSFLIFGVNEFSARLPSALLGFGCILLTYLVGKNLFNRFVGLVAAMMLTSSVWFIFRSREADLDIPSLFFYLSCVYTAAKVKSNPRWLYLLAISLAAVFQVKSFIGLTVVPAVIILLFLARTKLTIARVVLSLTLLFTAMMPWLISNYIVFGTGFINRLLAIGLRSDHQTLFNPTALTYLHVGIGKWYYPAILSLFPAILLIKKRPSIAAFLIIILILLTGFLTNSKTEIWHIVSLYPFLFIVLAVVIYDFLLFKVVRLAGFLFIISVAIWQIYNFRYNIRLTDVGYSDLAKVSVAARGRVEPLYLDGQDFFPSTVFYSQKKVILDKAAFPPPDNNLLGIIKKGRRPFLLITEDWRLRTDKVDPNDYRQISKSGSWVLIEFRKNEN